MRYLVLAALCVALATAAVRAQSASCTAAAAEKKLAGAALASFMKKCKSDASKACGVSAAATKLSGAARTSFVTRCVKNKVGP